MALRRLLSSHQHKSCSLLDYGAGSGILSFAALRFGADRAVGVEIDADALAFSRLNAMENAMEGAFEALSPDEEAARGATYEVVVANILAGVALARPS